MIDFEKEELLQKRIFWGLVLGLIMKTKEKKEEIKKIISDILFGCFVLGVFVLFVLFIMLGFGLLPFIL